MKTQSARIRWVCTTLAWSSICSLVGLLSLGCTRSSKPSEGGNSSVAPRWVLAAADMEARRIVEEWNCSRGAEHFGLVNMSDYRRRWRVLGETSVIVNYVNVHPLRVLGHPNSFSVYVSLVTGDVNTMGGF